MKLWQKVFLIGLAFVMLSVSVTALFVSQSYFSLIIRTECDRAAERHAYLSSGIVNRIAFERLRTEELLLSDERLSGIITDAVSGYGGGNAGVVVYDDNGEVCAGRGVYIRAVPDFVRQVINDDASYALITDDEYYIIGSPLQTEGKRYYLFTSTDFGTAYTNHGQAMRFIRYASIGFAVITEAILLAVVYRLIRPLSRVNDSIRTIASGDYAVRADVRGSAELRELAANVNIMASAIEQNVDELQEIADSRKRFIDNLAHEMKTPLTSIMCLSDVMRIKRDITPAERVEYAGIIMEEAGRLRALSGKLMELTVAGNAQLDFTDHSLEELLGEVAAAAAPVLERDGMTLAVQPVSATVYADKELFQSMIYNLIDNARKASAPGDTVTVDGGVQDYMLTLYVRDNGFGMTEEELRHVTEPFYMADKSRSRKAGGAGLGLSLCAEIARRHNAQLTITSEKGKGTTVCLSMRIGGGRDD